MRAADIRAGGVVCCDPRDEDRRRLFLVKSSVHLGFLQCFDAVGWARARVCVCPVDLGRRSMSVAWRCLSLIRVKAATSAFDFVKLGEYLGVLGCVLSDAEQHSTTHV